MIPRSPDYFLAATDGLCCYFNAPAVTHRIARHLACGTVLGRDEAPMKRVTRIQLTFTLMLLGATAIDVISRGCCDPASAHPGGQAVDHWSPKLLPMPALQRRCGFRVHVPRWLPIGFRPRTPQLEWVPAQRENRYYPIGRTAICLAYEGADGSSLFLIEARHYPTDGLIHNTAWIFGQGHFGVPVHVPYMTDEKIIGGVDAFVYSDTLSLDQVHRVLQSLAPYSAKKGDRALR